jgi:hypothetical protein
MEKCKLRNIYVKYLKRPDLADSLKVVFFREGLQVLSDCLPQGKCALGRCNLVGGPKDSRKQRTNKGSSQSPKL